MALIDKINKHNFVPTKLPTKVSAEKVNELIDLLNTIAPSAVLTGDVLAERTAGTGVTADGVLLKDGTVIAKKGVEVVTSKHLSASESGKVIYTVADDGVVSYVLPTAAPGLTYKFVIGIDRTDAITIVTADITDTTGEMIRGGVLVCAAAAVNTFVEATADKNTITLDDNVNNCGAGVGSWIELVAVSTKLWLVTGVINSTTDADGNGSAIFSDTD